MYKINNNSIDVDYGIDTTQLIVIPPINVYNNQPDREIETISAVERKTDYYKVTIEANGWYNIDALFKDWSGASASKLIVRLQGEYSSKQEFYLAIPSIKVLVQGGYLANGEDIGFYEKDGSIPLPLGAKAYVFAIGEEKGNFYYSQTEFIVQASQTITLKAEKISKEDFDKKARKLENNGLKVKTDPTTQFTSLKSLDEQLEKIREEGSKHCGCGNYPSPSEARDSVAYDYVQGNGTDTNYSNQ